MDGGCRGAQRHRRCVPELTAHTTLWCRAGLTVSVPDRELSRGVAGGTVLHPESPAHEGRNLPGLSVALRCRAGPMTVRLANLVHRDEPSVRI